MTSYQSPNISLPVRAQRKSPARLLKGVVMMLVLLIGCFAFVTSPSVRAEAATDGPGITFADIGHIGAFRLADGSLTYCMEIAALSPYSDQHPSGVSDTLPAYSVGPWSFPEIGWEGTVVGEEVTSPTRIRQLNYVLETWGQTNDNVQAAATQIAVFTIRGTSTHYLSLITAHIERNGGAEVLALADSIVNDAQANAKPPVPGVTPAEPVLQLNETGSGTLKYSAGTHTLRLTNAVFRSSGMKTAQVNPAQAGQLEIDTVPPEGWDNTVEVTAEAAWQSGAPGWRAELRLHEPVTPRQQLVGSSVGLSSSGVQSGTQTVTALVSRTWWPTLSTSVTSSVAQVGDQLIDEVTVAAHPDGSEWLQNASGDFAPLRLSGTLYGPLPANPTLEPQHTAPLDAPVAAQKELLITDGPGTYTADPDFTVKTAGFYTWVWRIDWDEQPAEVVSPKKTGESALKHEMFPVMDRFGEASETHTVQQPITLTTQLQEHELGLGGTLIDDVTVHAHPDYEELVNENVPVTLTGYIYHQETQPEQQHEVPADALEVSKISHVLTGEDFFSSTPVALPIDLEGYVTVRWCIEDSEQPQEHVGLTPQWCDDYGVPTETASISAPHVVTLAQAEAVEGGTMTDIAEITGPLPNESSLEFTAYLMPEADEPRYDENWQPLATGDTWGEEEIASMTDQERCLAQPVAVTEEMMIERAGTHRSPEVLVGSVGTIHWVERLYGVDPITDEKVLIHEGECGIANERTTSYSVEAAGEVTVVSTEIAELSHTAGDGAHQKTLAMSGIAVMVGGLVLVAFGLWRRTKRIS